MTESGAAATPQRHVHPVTPLVHGVNAIPVALLAFVVMGQGLVQRLGVSAVVVAVFGSLVVAAVVAGFQYLAWQRLTFWFDSDGDLRVDSGVVSRSERRLQLSRLQSVDVVQPLVARIFSMAQVRVEVAGAGESRVTLSYLTLADAQALRNEVLARAAGLRHDVGEAPEQVLVTVPTQDLLVSLLLRTRTVALLGLTVLILVTNVLTAGVAGLLALVTGGVPLFLVFGEFARYFNFTVAESPDGLRLRSGLLRTETRTVPPGRVQAIGYVEPFLWRRQDWIRIQLNVAGVGAGDEGEGSTETVLLPVAPRPVARGIVGRVLPGVDVEGIPMRPAPARAIRRSPIQGRRLGVGWNETVFVARRGRVTRHLQVVPHARTQSVRVTQGPWERALGLASVHVDSTPGPVRISGLHRDAADARRIADEQTDRARHARSVAPPTRWMSTPPAAPPEPPAGGEA